MIIMITELLKKYLTEEEVAKANMWANATVNYFDSNIMPRPTILKTRNIVLLYPLIMKEVSYFEMRDFISEEDYAAMASRLTFNDDKKWHSFCMTAASLPSFLAFTGIRMCEIEEEMYWKNRLKKLWNKIKKGLGF